MLTETQLGKLRNFRDLGGSTTRSGRQVRSGAICRCGCMHLWSQDEADVIRTGLRPKTLIDLRRPDEAQQFPVPVEQLGARWVNVPFPTKSRRVVPKSLPSLVDTYLEIVRRSGPSIVRLLEELSEPDNLPAIVFCAAGKDRTGVATAILLGALNVDDEQIVADYARTGVIDPITLGEHYAAQFANLPDGYRGSDPQTMRAVLAALRAEHGSMRTLVANLGFGVEGLVALERALLTPQLAG